MKSMFSGCVNLKSINLNNFNTSEVTNMTGMFENYKILTNLKLSHFNTSKVIYMGSNSGYGGMCRRCSNLKELDLSSFDTSKETDMSYMFSNMK